MARYSPEERARILAALERNGGNVKATAREFGIAPSTVRTLRNREAGEPTLSQEVAKVEEAYLQAAETDEFSGRLQEVIDLSLARMKASIRSATPNEAVRVFEVLQKVKTVHEGKATSRTETVHTVDGSSMVAALQGWLTEINAVADDRAEAVRVIEASYEEEDGEDAGPPES